MPTLITNDPQIIAFLDQFVDHDLDFSEPEYDEWYCINISPFKCSDCGAMVCYAQVGTHLIIIWPNKDDETILELAQLLMEDDDYDPRIVKYNRILGPCISYAKAEELGWISSLSHG